MSFINGLNFRRNIFGDGEVTKINVEQVLEMKRQRLLEKEMDNSNEALINNLCDVKFNYDKTKCNLMKSGHVNILCNCWYIFNEFIPVNIQESMEVDGNKEISIFNNNSMNRFRLFLNPTRESNDFTDVVSWEMLFNNDSVNRFVCEISEMECLDIMDNNLLKITNDKWAILKQYFDYLKTNSNDYLMKILSSLCERAISSFSITTFDLALLYGVHNASEMHTPDNPLNSGALVKRPIIFVIKYKCAIDFMLIPLLFRKAGIDSPVYFVGENDQVINMKSILSRIGYVIVRNDATMKFPKIQSFVVEKKAALILEGKRSICLVINDSINAYFSASGKQTETRVLHSAVNGFLDGKLEEPIIVPLSLSHEYIPRQFLSRSSSLLPYNTNILMTMMASQLGIVKLSISKPIYYTQFASNSDHGISLPAVDTEQQVKVLMKHLSIFSDRCQLIMPSNLVSFLLLYHFKDQKMISLINMANVGYDLIKYVLSSESLGFEFSSVITTVRRGCNTLSNLINVSKDQSEGSEDILLTIDWDSYSVLYELDMYADVIVHKILLKSVAATAFISEARFSHTTNYIDQITLTSDAMTNSITNIVKILLSRYFQFLLPCETLDGEITQLNTWWNETMISATKESDTLYLENEYHSDSSNWRADVYDTRVRYQILMLSRCLAPRLESLNFIVMELMRNKQTVSDSLTLCSELYDKYVDSIKKAGKCSHLRFNNCMNKDYFISGIMTLASHEMVRIFDISTREWLISSDLVNLISSRYAILDCEYYNLQRWKTFIDLSIISAI